MEPANLTLPKRDVNDKSYPEADAPAPEPLPLLVSPGRAATELGLARTTVYKMIRTGELPAVQVHGRRLAIRRPVLLRFAEALPDYPTEQK